MNLTVIVGITGSGKTKKAIDLYKDLPNCLIIGCDSRQIYTNSFQSANIPTGLTKKYNDKLNAYYIEDIPHFLINQIDPTTIYTLNDYLRDVKFIVDNVKNIENVILVGGTGMWAKAILDEYNIKEYEDQKEFFKIKSEIAKLSISKIKSEIADNTEYLDLNNSDKNNPRRLVNILSKKIASERCLKFKPFNPITFQHKKVIVTEKNVTKAQIEIRMQNRIDQGMMDELENLYNITSPERMKALGMQYKIYAQYKEGLVEKSDLLDLFVIKEIQYQKRQITWNKKYFREYL